MQRCSGEGDHHTQPHRMSTEGGTSKPPSASKIPWLWQGMGMISRDHSSGRCETIARGWTLAGMDTRMSLTVYFGSRHGTLG